MKIRTLIVDDERIARQRLRRLLAKEDDVEIVAECADGAATVEAVREHKPDLLLLDIQMPDMDGFDVLDAFDPSNQPVIVFVTAFDQHAVHAFETCALDYLLKPVSPIRLMKALERVRYYLDNSKEYLDRVSQESALPHPRRFSVRSGQRTSFIAPEEIDWIEADGNYAILHVGAQNHLLRETMSALETQLPDQDFVRVGRSAILHLNRVREVQSAAGGRHFAILNDGQRVPLTRSVREISKRLRSARAAETRSPGSTVTAQSIFDLAGTKPPFPSSK
jgi:two-component system, LytTR family, response regulator